jgi:hypothetical protein
MTFDHRVLPIPIGDDGRIDLMEFEQALKNEGAKGWELVGVLPGQDLGAAGRAHLLLFKRRSSRDVFHGG